MASIPRIIKALLSAAFLVTLAEGNSHSADKLAVPQSIEILLTQLENSSNPELKGGVLFSTRCDFSPPVEKFTCRKCGKKTVYDISNYEGDRKAEIDRYSDIIYSTNYKIRLKDLSSSSIKHGVFFSVDDSDFCSNCGKNKLEKRFYLLTSYPNGVIMRRTILEPTDLRKLTSFFMGNTIWITDDSGEKSLKKEIPLIKYLLGLDLSQPRDLPVKSLTPSEKRGNSSADFAEKMRNIHQSK